MKGVFKKLWTALQWRKIASKNRAEIDCTTSFLAMTIPSGHEHLLQIYCHHQEKLPIINIITKAGNFVINYLRCFCLDTESKLAHYWKVFVQWIINFSSIFMTSSLNYPTIAINFQHLPDLINSLDVSKSHAAAQNPILITFCRICKAIDTNICMNCVAFVCLVAKPDMCSSLPTVKFHSWRFANLRFFTFGARSMT